MKEEASTTALAQDMIVNYPLKGPICHNFSMVAKFWSVVNLGMRGFFCESSRISFNACLMRFNLKLCFLRFSSLFSL